MPASRLLLLDATSPLGAAILLRLAPGHDVVAHVPATTPVGATGEFACRLVRGEAVAALAVEPGLTVVAPSVTAGASMLASDGPLPGRWIQCVDVDDRAAESAATALLVRLRRAGVATTLVRHAPLAAALVRRVRTLPLPALLALARRPGRVAPVAEGDVAEVVARLVDRPVAQRGIAGPEPFRWADLLVRVRRVPGPVERWCLAAAARCPARGRAVPALPRVGRRRLAAVIARLDAAPPARPADRPATGPIPVITA